MTTTQDLLIITDGVQFRLLNQGDRTEVGRGEDAAVLIQESVDFLSRNGGGELELGRGVYPINQTIRIGSNVSVVGKGSGTRLEAAVDLESVLATENSHGVRLRSFCVTNAGKGKAAVGLLVKQAADFQAQDIVFKGMTRFGLHMLSGCGLCEIRGCRAYNCEEAGYCMQDLYEQGALGSFVPNLLSNCVAAGGGVGFSVRRAVVLNLLGCIVFQSGSHGFELTYESNSVALTGCRTFQVGGDAYTCHQANEINLTGNVFCWTRGNGIVLSKTTWGTISGNEIIDSGVRTADGSHRHGILITNETRGLQISGNAIFNWADQCPMHVGVEEDASCYGNNIIGNSINYYRKSGLISKGQDTVVDHNLCAGNWYMWDPSKPYPDFDRDRLMGFIERY